VNSSPGTFNPEQLIIERLQSKCGELTTCLSNADVSGAFSVIEHINATKEESIYYGLGMLARGLHTAITNFEVDDHGKAYLAHQDSGAAAQITNQLDYVVEMSEEAARRTLNILENSSPVIKELKQNATDIEAELRELSPSLADRMRAQQAGLDTLDANLMEILMAQGFQDLSGQAIRKVNGILENLQADLVALLKYANQVKSMSERVTVEFPVIGELVDPVTGQPQQDASTDEDKQEAMAQDDVDDLLSSLGF